MAITRIRLPSLNGLRAFVAAGKHLNFRLAAEELGVTQGAVAQHIRSLEIELGSKLFDRMPRSVALTEVGRNYLVEITRAFDIIADATASARVETNHVTLNVTPSLAARWLLPNLRDFRRAHPEIEVSFLATDKMPDLLHTGIDLVIRDAKPPFPKNSQHEFFAERQLIAVASPRWIDAHGRPVTAKDLTGHVLLHDMENEWPFFLRKKFGTDHIEAAHNITFNFATLAIDAAVADEGIAIASLLLVKPDLKAGRLVQVFPDVMRSTSDYYIIAPNRTKDRVTTKVVWRWLTSTRDSLNLWARHEPIQHAVAAGQDTLPNHRRARKQNRWDDVKKSRN